MCGLAGIFGDGARFPAVLHAMAASIAHRGPDDQGIWSDDEAGIGLAHRRLAVVDLSPMGHQPMASANGRFILAFNGEIYNHRALRSELDARDGIPWRGHSDTETLVEAIAAWGVEEALRRSVGMFALAVWDRAERTLTLARDRFGEKPLYYGWAGGDFVFASELKALRRHPDFDNDVDRRALRLLAARAYVPAPFSIYRNIYKLEPGCLLTIANGAAAHPMSDPPSREEGGTVRLRSYWSYRRAMVEGLADPIRDEAEAMDGLEAALAESIAGQAVADVPVGAFLSGGIDSSTVVALYQAHAPGRVKTFSIGFKEAGFDEAVHAREVARHFGTEHHERYLSFHDAQAVIPSLPAIYDEPFADSSQIPTHLVSALAREHVTVALSGDGGDELFGGYNRYIATARLWSRLYPMPRCMRTLAGGGMAAVPPAVWNGLSAMLPSGRRPAFFGSRLQRFFRTVRDASSLDHLMTLFLDNWSGLGSPVLPPAPFPREGAFDLDLGVGAPDPTRMMYCDGMSYLPDDILCKVDRAAMAVSLETRIPFLDHRVAGLAARIPLSMKIRDGVGKAILRRLLCKHAPAKLFDRPKAGFAIPVGEWIRGPLRPWAESLLDPAAMMADGYFDTDLVQRSWRAHLSGKRDSTEALWTILMFQAWRGENQL